MKILICGLGNPGERYKETRHNVGFWAIEKIREKYDFPSFSFESKFEAELAKKEIKGKEVILLKPMAFMNLSGRPIKKISNFYKIKRDNILIFHDDIDLDLGRIKVVKNRGSAGHKGVESIFFEIGKKDLVRARIGIKNFERKDKEFIKKYVLERFSKEEKTILEEKVLPKIFLLFEAFIGNNLEKALPQINAK